MFGVHFSLSVQALSLSLSQYSGLLSSTVQEGEGISKLQRKVEARKL